MRNVVKTFGIISMVLIIGFSFALLSLTGCDNGSGNGGGDDGTITIDGWKWSEGYGDSGDGGTSTVTRTQGTGDDSKKLTYAGNVQKVPGQTWGYAGWHSTPNSENLTKLRTGTSISFKVKGNGDARTFRVEACTSDVKDYNYHSKTFLALLTENTITIPYSELAQQNWGDSSPTVAFDKNKITYIRFQAEVGTTGEGPFSITIWDLQVNGGSGGPINPGTGGTFTVTDIPSQYNGKYAFFEGIRDNPELYVFGCQSVNFATETVVFTQISNGRVSLPMWTSSDGVSAVRYSGNGTVYGFIGISSSATATGDIDANAIGSRGWRSITFSNGSATKSWNDGEDL